MKWVVAAVCLALCSVTSAGATTVYGITDEELVTFNSANPAVTTSSVQITGVPETLDAIDFRPLNRVLYGLSTDRIVYTIDVASGAATAVSGVLNILGAVVGFDFNPTIDRLRIVTNENNGDDNNYVFDPNTGTLVTMPTDLFYRPGDVNFGRQPSVVAAAYTQTGVSPQATSQLFVIDAGLNILARQANSAGTLDTVGPLGFNFGSFTSFDISGSNVIAQNGDDTYSINLLTGQATSLGSTEDFLLGIAIAPVVPEPATWLMMILGLGMTGRALRRSRATLRFAKAL